MRHYLYALTTLPFIIAAAGCDAEAGPGAATVRDSAGIEIVEHSPGAEPARWQLGEPTLALGSMDAGGPAELYQPLHALRLEDGRVVVANQGTEELRFFGSGGEHLRTVGGTGGGPGEFEGMWGLGRAPGDSLAVWDWNAKRLSLYDDQGNFGRVVTPSGDVGGFVPRFLGTLPERSFSILKGFDPATVFATGGGVRQDSVILLRLSLDDGAIIDSVGPFPGAEQFVSMGDGSFWMRSLLLGKQEHVVVGGDRIFVGDDRTGTIRMYSPDGTLRRVIRLGGEPRPVRDEDVRAYREQSLEGTAEDELPEQRRRLEETPVAETLPAFADLFADRLGRLWVERFDGQYDQPDTWSVLGPDGLPQAQVTMPTRMRPLDAGEDYVLAYTQDELDIERIQLHPILTTPETQ